MTSVHLRCALGTVSTKLWGQHGQGTHSIVTPRRLGRLHTTTSLCLLACQSNMAVGSNSTSLLPSHSLVRGWNELCLMGEQLKGRGHVGEATHTSLKIHFNRLLAWHVEVQAKLGQWDGIKSCLHTRVVWLSMIYRARCVELSQTQLNLLVNQESWCVKVCTQSALKYVQFIFVRLKTRETITKNPV